MTHPLEMHSLQQEIPEKQLKHTFEMHTIATSHQPAKNMSHVNSLILSPTLIITLLILSLTYLPHSTFTYNITPCLEKESLLSKQLSETNSFGAERKNILSKMKLALVMHGFNEKQVARYEGLRSMAMESQVPDAEKEGHIRKLCSALMDDYVRNCELELKSLFKRKSPFEIKMAMKKVLRKRKFTSTEDKEELISLAQEKEFDQICHRFADLFYHEDANIYRSDEDEDDEEPYYPYPELPLSKAELMKLSNAQLRQIMDDRNQKCKGCRVKKDYVLFAEQIQNMTPMKNLDKMKEYRKRKNKASKKEEL